MVRRKRTYVTTKLIKVWMSARIPSCQLLTVFLAVQWKSMAWRALLFSSSSNAIGGLMIRSLYTLSHSLPSSSFMGSHFLQ
jgi:hypothetical protein